jgi:hypothetical protein
MCSWIVLERIFDERLDGNDESPKGSPGAPARRSPAVAWRCGLVSCAVTGPAVEVPPQPSRRADLRRREEQRARVPPLVFGVRSMTDS